MTKHPNKKPSDQIAKPRLRWYVNGVVIIIVTLTVLVYLSFIQATQAYLEAPDSLDLFLSTFISRMVKSSLLVLAAAIFFFFFSIQDYQMTIEKLMVTLADSTTEDLSVDGRLLNSTTRSLRRSTRTQIEDLDAITHSITSILQEKEIYIEQLDYQGQQILETLITRLLKGWVKDGQQASDICLEYGIDIAHERLQVLVFGEYGQVKALPEEALLNAYERLQTILEEMFHSLFVGYSVEIEGLLAVLVLPSEGESLLDLDVSADLLSIVKLAMQMVFEESGTTLMASIGSVLAGISGVARSYAEAVEALQYTNLIGADTKVLTHRAGESEQIASERELQWLRQELQFVNRIDIGDIDGAAAIYLDILDASSQGAPASELVRYRMLNLSNMMVTAIGRMQLVLGESMTDYQALVDCITQSSSLPELRENVLDVFEVLHEQSLAHKSQSFYVRMMDVIEYVQENFRDQNLSVAAVAHHFDFNPSYLSRTFKRVMNVGLATYIQHIRVEAAKSLLKDSHVSVKKAAEMVGFSNVLTMNRAFRRLEGTTAGRSRQVVENR
ncbi:MAG: helix-turn-helix domain-containing protein [Coriobacteriales bacterium]|jgi:AraC-like DNA-binding protein|nr:helix-turn-helix domain-containing protein [Coriobacteriales bacterium]